MNRNHLLVGGAVAVVCAGILVLFTDIEVRFVEWVNCGPFAVHRDRDSHICR